jgi:hypothetical protein
MTVERRKIKSNLPSKGFVIDDTKHHIYFYHEFQGRRTGSYTYISKGSKIKTYGIELIKQMRKQLMLDNNRQVVELCKCPIDKEAFNEILKDKGIIA